MRRESRHPEVRDQSVPDSGPWNWPHNVHDAGEIVGHYVQAISVATLGRRFTTSRTEPPILIFSVPKGCSFDVSYRQFTSATDLAMILTEGVQHALVGLVFASGTRLLFLPRRAQSVSAFGGKADITPTCANVCF